ncbi:hypothetical protein PIB30_090083 [Stylosanthes scabra]|uniref:Uncharacterized protein n=1 Tax=Stylosanthes scabra TaxID=79078 RepID=A0ABU6RVK3_9FABA|nr:hypothetical protein [Stylosanthes scabra]
MRQSELRIKTGIGENEVVWAALALIYSLMSGGLVISRFGPVRAKLLAKVFVFEYKFLVYVCVSLVFCFGSLPSVKSRFDPDNNVCTKAISDVIELMLNEPWINYSEVPADVQKRWYEKWAEKEIRKAFDYRVGRRYQQIMRDLRDGELQRLKWLSETLRGRLLHRFATDPGLLKRSGVNKVNRASSTSGCLHTGGSATIPKTQARMTRSLDRPPINAEVFRETHTRKRDRSIFEKCADDLLTEYSTNLEQATQQAQEEGDESAAIVDPNFVWRQTLSETCKNRVYGAGGFFASSLHRSGYGGSSASATSSHTGPADAEVVNLRKQVQNLTQSLHSQGEVLQQQTDEVRSLKETLAERDAWADEQIRRLKEMQRQMAAYYDPLCAASSTTAVGGSSSSSTAPPPLQPRPPPPPAQPDHGPADDDNDYEDA